MCLCLGSWSRHDLVRDEDILAAVHANMGKGKRKAVEMDQEGGGSELDSN